MNKMKVLILGLFFAITLSHSELYNNTEKLISDYDEYNAVKMAISSYNSIKRGALPLRVVDGLYCNLGYPLHQFYSPFPYIFIAFLSLIDDNIFTGFALAVIFALTASFIFSYNIIKYLFKSDLYALTGGILYIFAPYTSITRATRGAFAEFFALCLVPIVLYFIVKVISRFSIKYFILSIIGLVILFNTHLITSLYFIVFSGIFLLFNLIFTLYNSYILRNKRQLKNYIIRITILISILLFSLSISAWSFIPIINFNEITMRHFLDGSDLADFKYFTSILSLFSISDASPSLNHLDRGFRLQSGFIFNLTLLLFLLISFKKRSIFNIPIFLTQCIILLVIIYPFNKNSIIQHLFFLTQFTYRFVIFYQLIGIIIVIIVVKTFVSKFAREKREYIKIISCISIIIYTILSDIPYQNKVYFNDPTFGEMSIEQIKKNEFFFTYANTAYSYQPQFPDLIPVANPKFLVNPVTRVDPADQTFIVNLGDYSSDSEYRGFLDFNILYYPGLQYIRATIDGVGSRNIAISPSKYRLAIDNGRYIFSHDIHTFRLSGLPSSGRLEVRAVFEGDPVANLISKTSLVCLVLLASGWPFLKWARARRRDRRASDGASGSGRAVGEGPEAGQAAAP